VNIGHRGNPAKNERHLRHIAELLFSFRIQQHPASPRPNGNAGFRVDDIVCFRHLKFSKFSLAGDDNFAAGLHRDWR
jgi:hypothetical protein